MNIRSKPDGGRLQRAPVHRQLVDILRREILRQHAPGDRFGSQNVLARRFGVSPTTVREAVNALVQAGLLARRHGSGTYVANPVAGKVAGILIEQDLHCPGTSYFWLRLIQCLQDALRLAGFPCRLYTGHTRSGAPEPAAPTSTEFWDDLEHDRLLGVAMVGTAHGAWEERLAARQVPLISAEALSSRIMPNVAQDMVCAAVEFLAAAGRRRLGVVAWGSRASPGTEVQVFRGAVGGLGLQTQDAWIWHGGTPRQSMAGWQGIEAIWRRAGTKPDGLLVVSDLLVPGALAAVAHLGIPVPEQLLVAVHSHRDAPVDPPPFPVIEMEADPDAVAATLAAALVQHIKGVALPLDPCRACRLVVPPELGDLAGAAPPLARTTRRARTRHG